MKKRVTGIGIIQLIGIGDIKHFALFLMLIAGSFSVIAVDKTTNNVTGNWTTAGVWTDGVVPSFTNIPSTNVNYVINGTVGVGTFPQTNSVTMDFINNKDAYNFTVNGTLVVYGNMTFGNKAMNLIIPAGGIVIVMGNLTSDNQINLSNGGILVVKGTTTFNGGNGQNNYSGSGSFWPIGGLSGGFVDPDATTAAATSGDFNTNASASIQNIVNGSVNPLPIELLFFRGNVVEGKVNLSWATLSELNFDYFEVERSDKANDFGGIGKIRGQGTTTVRHDYSLTDEKPLIGKNYYRLKSVDFDGFTEYSKVIAIDFSADKKFEISPNPTTGTSLGFTLNFIPESRALIIIYDNFSNVVAQYSPSTTSHIIAFSNPLKSGMYYAKILSGEFVNVQRFVVN